MAENNQTIDITPLLRQAGCMRVDDGPEAEIVRVLGYDANGKPFDRVVVRWENDDGYFDVVFNVSAFRDAQLDDGSDSRFLVDQVGGETASVRLGRTEWLAWPTKQ